MEAEKSVVREVAGFVRAHLAHILLSPLVAVVVTFLHETAHAAAALAYGGEVTHFVFLPGDGNWGSMRYVLPQEDASASLAISLAPYVMWAALAAGVALFACLRGPVRFSWASTLFVWGYVVALGDIANTAFPFLMGAHNDFHSAFGPPSARDGLTALVAAAIATCAGFSVHQRLYGTRALSVRGFTGACVVFATCLGLLWAAF